MKKGQRKGRNIFLSDQERPDIMTKQRTRTNEKHPDKMIFRQNTKSFKSRGTSVPSRNWVLPGEKERKRQWGSWSTVTGGEGSERICQVSKHERSYGL